ncbi:hypothetical protein [Polaromonas sp.]|uniref:hypothetical protein n=1 Tax=Polaromonas sp. TaxID=1869339 RepID=UPI003BB4BD57
MQEKENTAQFSVVQQARSWLEGQISTRRNKPALSASTIESYTKDHARLKKKGGDIWKAAADTTKKSSYFKYRAAILHNCRLELERLISEQDELQQNSGLFNPSTKLAWSGKVAELNDVLNVAIQTPDQPQLQKFQNRATKRANLSRLPNDWREQLIDRMPKYRAQAAITALSGCRPAELVAGIQILLTKNLLTVLINGAKVGAQSGQEWRQLNWQLPSESPLVMLVEDMIIDRYSDEELSNCDELTFYISTPDAKAFSGAMREAGKRAFPLFTKTNTITPYSMRHQFSSDMKTAELPGDDISKALGHCASKTKGSYGEFGPGRAGMSPNSIIAARHVKPSPVPTPALSNFPSFPSFPS